MNNSSSVARGIEVGFTIAPGGGKAAWELSAKFVGGVQDKELMEDYSALADGRSFAPRKRERAFLVLLLQTLHIANTLSFFPTPPH